MDKSTTTTKRKKTSVNIADIGRLQPQALELEKAVLGALMLEKDAFYEVSEILKDECFYEPRH
ncbi:MAG TPA: DnaB-like helicase N-terminal domain-containing protein, partial [Bacteroidales bacterium]|nr:DnaB-like helicase N-terminal domain-containing protein [Bacteroidales bacterium]